MTISFRAPQLDFAGTYKTGGINSVETTRLARTETRHDFLVHEDLLRVSLYGRRQRFGSTADFYSKSTLTYIHHARVKAKVVFVKAVQGTCLRTN